MVPLAFEVDFVLLHCNMNQPGDGLSHRLEGQCCSNPVAQCHCMPDLRLGGEHVFLETAQDRLA